MSLLLLPCKMVRRLYEKNSKLLALSCKETGLSLFFPSFFILPKFKAVFQEATRKKRDTQVQKEERKEHDSSY